MSTKRSYAVVGTGAIGGFYGARLAVAGHPVHFLLRSDVEHVRAHGLRVQSTDGDIHLTPVSAHADAAAMPRCDVVLVALKTTANAQLRSLLPPLLGPATTVVLLQNGLGVEDDVAPLVDGRPLLGGLCYIAASKVGPGHVRHLGYGTVTLAQHGATEVTEAVLAVAEDLRRAGVPVREEADLVLARWRKLMWNIPFNGLSVVLGALPHELLADPAGAEVVEQLMREVQAGAAACGREIPDAFLDELMALTVAMPPYSTSMKLDFDGGRALELDSIFAAPARAARAAGRPLPALELLHRELEVLDRRRATGLG